MTHDLTRNPLEPSLNPPHDTKHGNKTTCITINWDSLRIAQCLELSLAETPKNENLLTAACHFWSNGVNAFLFGHGPMSSTLADVYTITGLDISGPMYPFQYRGSTRKT
jgi:hypothetical protein